MHLWQQNNQPRPAQNNTGVSEQLIQQITSMGFTRDQAVNALRVNNNNVEAATIYILDNPTPPQNTSQNQNGPLQELIEMGFSREKAENALRANNNDVNRAVNYLLANS